MIGNKFQWGSITLIVLTLAILAPAFINADSPPQIPWLQLPRVYSGDEPHYLVIINSFLNDGDFDLRNNYAAVNAGDIDAGQRWSNEKKLDHQVVLPVENKFVFWFETYDTQKWNTDGSGAALPILRKDKTLQPTGTPEYSIHQIGIAVLLAPLLYLVRGTIFVEIAAILTAGIATILAMFSFRKLLGRFTNEEMVIHVVTILTFLGTPLWAYGRSLFMEPFLLLFALSSYALVLMDKHSVLPGILMGIAMQLKPHFGIIAIPLIAYYLMRSEWKKAFMFIVPLLVSTGVILFTYAKIFGSALHPPQSFIAGNILKGILGLFISNKAGLVFFAPITILAIWCWPTFVRRYQLRAYVILGGFLIYFLLIAAYFDWSGGYSFGPRYLVPVIPFLLVSLVELPSKRYFKWATIKTLVIFICLISIALNALGAFYYTHYWGRSILPAVISSYLPIV